MGRRWADGFITGKWYWLYSIFAVGTGAVNQQVLKTVSGQQLPRTSWDKMQDIKIPVPPLAIQSQLVAEIAQLEQQIATHHSTISQAASFKQAVMKKYL